MNSQGTLRSDAFSLLAAMIALLSTRLTTSKPMTREELAPYLEAERMLVAWHLSLRVPHEYWDSREPHSPTDHAKHILSLAGFVGMLSTGHPKTTSATASTRA